MLRLVGLSILVGFGLLMVALVAIALRLVLLFFATLVFLSLGLVKPCDIGLFYYVAESFAFLFTFLAIECEFLGFHAILVKGDDFKHSLYRYGHKVRWS